jgi:hypothetical protein
MAPDKAIEKPAGGAQRLRQAFRATRPSVHRSLWQYNDAIFLKLSLLAAVVLLLAYLLCDPINGRRGSTWFGYTSGVIGVSLVVWLSWLGVRKRSFTTARAPVQMWVSAHVYFGLLLWWVATLHCAFQFGFNIHTFAYSVMVIVIVSGIYGVAMYGATPSRLTANREGGELKAMLAEIARLNDYALLLADRIDPETHAVVVQSVQRSRIGGNGWQQLTGRYDFTGDFSKLSSLIAAKEQQAKEAAPKPVAAPARGGTTFFVIDQLFEKGDEKTSESLKKLLQAIADRKALVEKVNRDITLRARLNVWLYLHVPMTVALIIALIAHIVSVFLLW